MITIRTLNLCSGAYDDWGTDKLDWKYYTNRTGIYKIQNLNINKTLPYKSATFDEIRFYDTIHLLAYSQEILNETIRILKLDGMLDITAPNAESLFWIFIQRLKEKPVRFGKQKQDNGHIYEICNDIMLENKLKEAGFNSYQRVYDVSTKMLHYNAWK